jgi:hypothetical protein
MGLAIVLNSSGYLESIIITEDKCTDQPRNLITQQVFKEFNDLENGKKDNALMSIIAMLIGQLDSGKILEKAQNNIFDTKYRVYRIGITREAKHNDRKGRKLLFKDYENNVSGENHLRRSAATIHLDQLRDWMDDFSILVIDYLTTKKS